MHIRQLSIMHIYKKKQLIFKYLNIELFIEYYSIYTGLEILLFIFFFFTLF